MRFGLGVAGNMIMTFLLGVMAISFVCIAYRDFTDKSVVVTEEITIEAGQTLWQVVGSRVGDKNDIRVVIDKALRDANVQDAGNIKPNQKFIISYKK